MGKIDPQISLRIVETSTFGLESKYDVFFTYQSLLEIVESSSISQKRSKYIDEIKIKPKTKKKQPIDL
jgi:hypothetical protein